jgi:hypothetical protein
MQASWNGINLVVETLRGRDSLSVGFNFVEVPNAALLLGARFGCGCGAKPGHPYGPNPLYPLLTSPPPAHTHIVR